MRRGLFRAVMTVYLVICPKILIAEDIVVSTVPPQLIYDYPHSAFDQRGIQSGPIPEQTIGYCDHPFVDPEGKLNCGAQGSAFTPLATAIQYMSNHLAAQMKQYIVLSEANLKSLSDANDALTSRVNALETEIRELEKKQQP
jgi:hypothetical protein